MSTGRGTNKQINETGTGAPNKFDSMCTPSPGTAATRPVFKIIAGKDKVQCGTPRGTTVPGHL